MTVHAERDGDHIVLSAPMVLKDRAKEVPGARYDSKTRTWRYPLSWAHCIMLRGVFGEELRVGSDLAHWAMEEVNYRITPAMEAKHG